MSQRLIAALALYRNKTQKLSFRDPTFPLQDLFVADTNRFLAAQCSRRAGKTNALALRFFDTLNRHPGAFCLYIALTRESARNIMWPVLEELDDKFKCGLIFTESNLTVSHPNGARLQLFGADMKNFIRRLKGIKTPGVAIDEAQDFGSHLESLVNDVLTPTLTDYKDSWLAITGTPGPVPSGYFYKITQERKFGFSLHKWTLLDNPYLPQAENFLNELIKKHEWEPTHPTLLREWKNQWVLDLQSLLIKYDEKKNHYAQIPQFKTPWTYILGVDIGFRDSDALALLAWHEQSSEIYLVEETTTSGQDISTLSSQIEDYMRRYDVSKIVMDEGGLGKKVAEEIRRRKHIPIQPADKARKMENVAFLNEWLRRGLFRAKHSSRFAQDSFMVQVDWEKTTPDKIRVKDSFHSDIIDAVLYAFKESPAFTFQEPKVKAPYGSKAWAEAEEDEMFEAELQKHQDMKNQDKAWGEYV
jgi:hypothetical protein